MVLSNQEAVDLARKCIPIMRHYDAPFISPNIERTLSSDDIKLSTKCRLWAGMGYIYTVSFHGCTFVVKRIMLPPKEKRSLGDVRKADSYVVEANFYETVAPDLVNDGLAIPIPYLVESENDQITICMSYLEGRGGPYTDDEIHVVLRWMAHFHAATWGPKADVLVSKNGLQPIGSYWHLDTRPSEHDSMSTRGWEGRLKKAARAIDERLKRDKMQCCIHGDAKDANMLFSDHDTNSGEEISCKVAMYDFQYCGKAPPFVDLAYFFCVGVGSIDESGELLTYYHKELLSRLPSDAKHPSFHALKDSLTIAFCDWQRFMSGWGNWGCDLSTIVKQTLDRLDRGKLLTEDGYRDAIAREFG
eukprot:scaffold12557_cov75-Cyclotella_meneghiniana.AAC.7